MSLPTNFWLNKYQERGAHWKHDKNPKRPHALLTGERHSNEFFNSELVMEDVLLLDEACIELTRLLRRSGLDLQEVDRVVGPAMGAITIAHELAYHIAVNNMRSCFRAYTEKDMSQIPPRMVFKRTLIRPEERVLLAEDTVTTGRSLDLTSAAVTDAGGIVLPFVAVLVNRSGFAEVNGRKIVPLIDHPTLFWVSGKCPFCEDGSEAIHPKTPIENWARLNAVY